MSLLTPPPHLPATASSASSSASSAASSLPTSTRPLTPPPEEGTHNQAGLRTGALGGSRWARGGEGGEGKGLRFLLRASPGVRAGPPCGRRQGGGPGEARPACAPPPLRPSSSVPPQPRPQPTSRVSPPPPPRTARRRRGVRRWGNRRAEPAARRGRSESTGGLRGAALARAAPGTLGRPGLAGPGRAWGEEAAAGGGGGPESLKGASPPPGVGASVSRGTGNLPEGLCLENWPAGNNGWERVPASMKGVMKHGFLQLAALTSQYCRSFTSH